MERDPVAVQAMEVYKTTGKIAFMALHSGIESLYEKLGLPHSDKPILYTNTGPFNESRENPHLESFMKNELDTQKFSTYMKDYGVEVSLKETSNGTSTLTLSANNLQDLEAGMKGLSKDLSDPQKTKALNQRLGRGSQHKTVQEKLTYHKKQVKLEVKERAQFKDKMPKMNKATEGRSLS